MKSQKIFPVLLLMSFIVNMGCTRTGSIATGSQNRIQVIRNEKTITIKGDDYNILSYHHAICDVPEGVNPLYRRSAFIHPLYSPAGHVLTRIQPPDHYHHYGIWNPWTKTHIDGQEIDFWNLAKEQGIVRFAGIESMQSGSDQGGFCVRQEHVQLKGSNAPRTAIEELWDIKASIDNLEDQKVWIIDLVSTLTNVLDVPIELDQYRYGGGLGFRATEQWTKDNSSVLTSEGKTRKNADATRARWCDVNGQTGNKGETCGVLFLSHPENYEHPEPMRVWPESSVNGRGEVFFEFCPIRLNSWTLQPNKKYVLRYRMIVYDGKLKPEIMEKLWQNYTHITQKAN